MKPKVVMSGVDSEYVLNELANFLRSRLIEVIEIDFGKVRGCVRVLLSKLSNSKTIYITSAHTALSLRSARVIAPLFARLYPNYLAPVEIIPILKPKVSVFVPHDLLSPYGDTNLNELKYLDIYDHIMATELTEELLAMKGERTRVHPAGWIKYSVQRQTYPAIPLVNSEIRSTFFLTNIQHMQYKYGIEGFVNYLRPVLNHDINVKLPAWQGIEAIESKIYEITGANILPANIKSVDLIEASDVVLCNSVSSVVAEAYLIGKPCICLLDDEGTSAIDKKARMQKFTNIIWHPYQERAPIPPEVIDMACTMSVQRRVDPFDFRMVESLVEEL